MDEQPDRTFYLAAIMKIVADATEVADEFEAFLNKERPSMKRSTVRKAASLCRFVAESQQHLFEDDAKTGIFDKIMDQYDHLED